MPRSISPLRRPVKGVKKEEKKKKGRREDSPPTKSSKKRKERSASRSRRRAKKESRRAADVASSSRQAPRRERDESSDESSDGADLTPGEAKEVAVFEKAANLRTVAMMSVAYHQEKTGKATQRWGSRLNPEPILVSSESSGESSRQEPSASPSQLVPCSNATTCGLAAGTLHFPLRCQRCGIHKGDHGRFCGHVHLPPDWATTLLPRPKSMPLGYAPKPSSVVPMETDEGAASQRWRGSSVGKQDAHPESRGSSLVLPVRAGDDRSWRREPPMPSEKVQQQAWNDLRAVRMMIGEDHLLGTFMALGNEQTCGKAWRRSVNREESLLHQIEKKISRDSSSASTVEHDAPSRQTSR